MQSSRPTVLEDRRASFFPMPRSASCLPGHHHSLLWPSPSLSCAPSSSILPSVRPPDCPCWKAILGLDRTSWRAACRGPGSGRKAGLKLGRRWKAVALTWEVGILRLPGPTQSGLSGQGDRSNRGARFVLDAWATHEYVAPNSNRFARLTSEGSWTPNTSRS